MADSLQNDPTPPDCFRLEDINTLRACAGAVLAQVNYYIWQQDVATPQSGFLFFLELIFADHSALMLSSGEDSLAIRISDAATLVGTAQRLQALQGHAVIQRMAANSSKIWREAIGKTLLSVQLSKHENGLYANSALLLSFDNQDVEVGLEARGGLVLR